MIFISFYTCIPGELLFHSTPVYQVNFYFILHRYTRWTFISFYFYTGILGKPLFHSAPVYQVNVYFILHLYTRWTFISFYTCIPGELLFHSTQVYQVNFYFILHLYTRWTENAAIAFASVLIEFVLILLQPCPSDGCNYRQTLDDLLSHAPAFLCMYCYTVTVSCTLKATSTGWEDCVCDRF